MRFSNLSRRLFFAATARPDSALEVDLDENEVAGLIGGITSVNLTDSFCFFSLSLRDFASFLHLYE